MTAETRPPARVTAAQLRDLGRYLRSHIYPYSAFYRARLDAAGVGRGAGGAELLRRLPLTTFDDVDDPSTLVLRPDERSIQRYADPGLLLRVFWAKLWNRHDVVNRGHVEPVYKPIHWHVDHGIPVGYSAEDVARLAELGRRLLVQAGLGRYDVVVAMLPPGPHLAYWETVLGCRRAGLSTLHLNPLPTPAQLEVVRPTVLAGRPADLERALSAARADGLELPGLHTLLAVGEPLDDRSRSSLRALAPGAAVVGAWAPPGVRSLWAECRDGVAYHTFPEVDLVEAVDPLTGGPAPGGEGELVWTGLGWKGSALLRLRTGVYGAVEAGPCPACGRTSPRVRLAPREPHFVTVLDRTPGLASWQAELREVDGVEELVVFVALDGGDHPGPLLRELDRELSVTQFVVLDRAALDQRLARLGDRRVVDLREGATAAHR